MVYKKIFYSILAFVISIELFSGCSYRENQLSQKHSKYIMVQGNAVINVKPDTAILKLCINTKGKNTIDIKLENDKIIDNIVNGILKLDFVDKKDIYISYSGLIEDGFSNDILVKVRDINKIGDIVSEATKFSSNIDTFTEFTVSDYDKYYKEALKKAIEDANNKAKDISKSLGVDLGSIVKIDEDQENNYNKHKYSKENNYNNENNNFTNINYGEKSNDFIGENKLIKVSVNVTFEY